MIYKGLLIAFLVIGGATNSNAQDISADRVPTAVKENFLKSYPKAKKVDWELKRGNYEAEFDLGRVGHKATYAPAGKILSFEKDIPNSKLPNAIAKSIKTKYPKARIDDVDLINTGGEITYKVDIEGIPDVNVWYSADGKFIKEVAD